MQTLEASQARPGDRAHGGAVLLTFRLEGEIFALPVERIQEILDPIEPTEVPLAPPHAPALLNVRGVIVPFFDLRERLRIRPRPAQADHRIVVVETVLGGTTTRLAIAADSVEAVIELGPDAAVPLPPLGSTWPEEFVQGVAQTDDGLVVLLDADALFLPARKIA